MQFKENLRDQYPDLLDYQRALADRSKLPRRSDFYNIYTNHFKEVFGAKNGQKMMDALNARIKESEEDDPGMSIFKQSFDSDTNKPFVLAIVTPFMKRVHSMVIIFHLILVQKTFLTG